MNIKNIFRILELVVILLAFIRTGILCSFDVLSIIIFIIGTMAFFFDWFVLEKVE